MVFITQIYSVLLICCSGIIAYGNSFHCSFHYDDQTYIVNNFAIRNLHHLLINWKFYPCRLVTFLSLVFNYHFNGLDVFGYHVFNLTVHLACALLVWLLVLLTLATPAMKDDPITAQGPLVALLAGMVFVTHPLQTESVTYIWQRTTSLAALFYLASLCFYIKSRLSPGNNYFLLSLLMALAAMFTKENSVTLPLVILLYEFTFLNDLKWGRLLVFLLTLYIIPLTILLTKAPQFQAVLKFSGSTGGTSPGHYLLTQFRVLVTYIRLMFLPLGQNIDYDYHISKSIFEGTTLLCFLLLLGTIEWARRLFSKYKLLSFSIFWFFISLSLESSVLPLKNIIFEHRLYLPLVGYSLFLVSGAYYLIGKKSMKAMTVIVTLVIAFYGVLTYQRNKVWDNEVTLWSDAVIKSPHKARSYNNLAFGFYGQGKIKEAIANYDKAIAINPAMVDAYVGRGLSFAQEGDFSEAIADYNKAIRMAPDFEEAYNNRGIFYYHRGNLTQAISDLTKAIALNPNETKAYYNRGLSYAKQGDLPQAVADYNEAVEIDPDYADAYYNRGLAFAGQRYFSEAIFDFNKAIELNPAFADAYNNRGITYATQGDLEKGVSDFIQATKIDLYDAQAYNNLVNAYYRLNHFQEAWYVAGRAKQMGIVINGQLLGALKEATDRSH